MPADATKPAAERVRRSGRAARSRRAGSDSCPRRSGTPSRLETAPPPGGRPRSNSGAQRSTAACATATHVSVAYSFAIDASSVTRAPASTSAAACRVSCRAAVVRASMSASVDEVDIVRRDVATAPVATAASIAPWAMPTACAEMPTRPLSSADIATVNPIALVAETVRVGNAHAVEHQLRCPRTVQSHLLERCPGADTSATHASTRKALTPRVPLPVRAITMYRSASPALVMNALEPLSTYVSPSCVARVCNASRVTATGGLGEREAREPRSRREPSADIATSGRHCQKRCSGSVPTERCTSRITALLASARATASMNSMKSRCVPPAPPYATGVRMPGETGFACRLDDALRRCGPAPRAIAGAIGRDDVVDEPVDAPRRPPSGRCQSARTRVASPCAMPLQMPGRAISTAAAAQLVEQGHEDAGTAGADRMSDRRSRRR